VVVGFGAGFGAGLATPDFASIFLRNFPVLS
jgi:hypothetical protein